MGDEKRIRNVWGGSFILLVLFYLTFWTYHQFDINYRKLEMSNKMFETLLNNQTDLMRTYKMELALFKQNLSATETLLEKVQQENEKLYQKIALLDKVAELEETISRLKDKNVLLINHIGSLKNEKPFQVGDLKTLREAEKIMVKYQDRVKKVKVRIKEIKREAVFERIATQKEKDRIKSLLGNNGFLVKNGEAIPMNLNDQPLVNNQNIKIDVSFVD